MLIGHHAHASNATGGALPPSAFRFLLIGEHVFDIDAQRLSTNTAALRLTPKVAAVLLQLARAAGRTLSRDALLDEVWKGTCPTQDVLTQAITDLRRALGDDPQAPRYIETLPRVGYRLIAPARFAHVLDDPPSTQSDPMTPTRADAALLQRLQRHGVLVSIVLLALMFVLILASRQSSRDAFASTARWQASQQRSITADPGAERFPRISPDGTRVAYSVGDASARNARVVQRLVEQSRVVRVSQIEAGEELYPVWSPDGASIAFMRFSGDECRIVSAPALGGAERLIGTCATSLLEHFSWASDPTQLISSAQSGGGALDMALRLLPLDGGKPRSIAYAHGRADIDLEPRYSPDGKRIAFLRGANPYSDLFLAAANGGEVVQLTHLASRIRGFDWTRDGSALVFSSGHGGEQALYVVSTADAHVEPLFVQPAEFPSSARATDTVVYEIPRLRSQLMSLALDAGAVRQDIAASTGSDSAPALSPLDERMLFVSDRGGAQQLWLYDSALDELVALTAAAEPTLRYPVWSADARRALVTVRGAANGSLIEIDIATRTRRVLTPPGDDVRAGVYGTRAQTYVAVVASQAHRTELIEYGTGDRDVASRRVLAHDVGRVETDLTSADLYFTKIAEPGLFKLDANGAPLQVTRDDNPFRVDAWKVVGAQVFYLAPSATGPEDLRVLDLASGVDRSVAILSESIADANFSISRDRRQLVVARAAAQDTDVGAVRIARVDAVSAQ